MVLVRKPSPILAVARQAARQATSEVVAAGEGFPAASFAGSAAYMAVIAHATPESPVYISASTAALDSLLL